MGWLDNGYQWVLIETNHFCISRAGLTIPTIWVMLYQKVVVAQPAFFPPLVRLLTFNKEYNKHDKEPSKYIKQWTGMKPKTGAPSSVT
ncbi:Actin-related protein [Artemisia annua]|uniref:Actin-related protein n=1 Tax=Artemisia annua TaxID=35608 RepID=A0A2U1L3J8_ARTAN|nr:Actin-related protein [Artemisia annua]